MVMSRRPGTLNLTRSILMSVDSRGLTRAQRQLLGRGIEQLGLSLSDEALNAIQLHLALVQKWRSRINLVSFATPEELITHHALDSLALLPLIEQSRQVLDIGTGAGFPGMQLAAARPGTHFTLLDSRGRRIEFLRLVSAQAKLSNTVFLCARVEDVFCPAGDVSGNLAGSVHSQVQAPAKFDTLLARAVASLDLLVEITIPLRFSGQRLIAMKGQYPHKELEVLNTKHSGQIKSVSVEKLDVPFLEAERHAVIIEYR